MFASESSSSGGVGGILNNMDSTLKNALNLFPSTSTPQQSQAKLQKLVYSATYRQPTPIQTLLAASLYDDGLQYMSTLEMNRAASFTYGYRVSSTTNTNNINLLGDAAIIASPIVTQGESVAVEMWQVVLDLTLMKYTQHSVLALTKTIHLIQHVLLHGAESCIMDGELLFRIEMAVEPLRNLNTALIEQKMVEEILNSEGRARGENDIVLSSEGVGQQLAQLGTRASAALFKIRGGSVDRGHPVRMAANKLHGMVSNPNNLRQLRMHQQQQSPADSLVPIGSAKQVGYITDEGRYKVLQAKMAAEERQLKQSQLQEQQRFRQTRSNLAGSSATDSFGGGYSSNGKLVVGAAHSLHDMIESAKYELEQHKVKQQQKIASLKNGYSDNPLARAQQLAELERTTNIESDPEYIKKKKALEDALEYLEEMQRLEQDKNVGVADLLGGDSSIGRSDGGRDQFSISRAGDAIISHSSSDGVVDLLGFEDNNNPKSQVDAFGGSSASFSVSYNSSVNFGGGADLLGFGTMPGADAFEISDGSSPFISNISVPMSDRGYMIRNSTSDSGNYGNKLSVGMRPSLVTGVQGVGGDNDTDDARGLQASLHHQPLTTPSSISLVEVYGNPMISLAPHLDEEAEAEKDRKLQMAAGLFAGVVPTIGETQKYNHRIPIMQNVVVDAIDLPSTHIQSSDPYFMGPMGGTCGTPIAGIVLPPPMAPPPPPPTQPPPPPAVTIYPNNDAHNALNNNLTVEQMQEMIQQQQAQMNQMMQMMQQMQMQGPNNASNI